MTADTSRRLRARPDHGVTLVELILTVTILAVGVIALIGSFKYIMTSLHSSEARTLATNLAQAQMEALKSQNYYTIFVTTSPYYLDATNAYPFDPYNYPPQTFTAGGTRFTQYTMVQYIGNPTLRSVWGQEWNPTNQATTNSQFQQITSIVAWGLPAACPPATPVSAPPATYNPGCTVDPSHIVKFSTTRSNPSSGVLSTGFYGFVYNKTKCPLCTGCASTARFETAGGQDIRTFVTTAENPLFNSNNGSCDVTAANAGAEYCLNVIPGTYTLQMQERMQENSGSSYAGASYDYYPQVVTGVVATSGKMYEVDFCVPPVTTGTISGIPQIVPPYPIISQVVGATTTAVQVVTSFSPLTYGPTFQGKDVEYVELFNPTTFPITMAAGCSLDTQGSCTTSNEQMLVNTGMNGTTYNDILCNSNLTSNNLGGCFFHAAVIPAGGYYLIANYPKFVAKGAWITADAYYNNSTLVTPQAIPRHGWGGVQLSPRQCPQSPGCSGLNNANSLYDEVCWAGDDGNPDTSTLGFCYWSNRTYFPVTCSLNGFIPTTCGLQSGGTCPGSSPWYGNQLVRFSTPTAATPAPPADKIRGTYGSSYNSRANFSDFLYPVSGKAASLKLNYPPFNSASPALQNIAGVPVGFWPPTASLQTGASIFISSPDPYGYNSTWAQYGTTCWPPHLPNNPAPPADYDGQYQAYSSSLTYISATTGVWTTANVLAYDQPVAAGSGQWYYASFQNVNILGNTRMYFPNNVTVPAWNPANSNNIFISSAPPYDFITGTVVDYLGNPLPSITVEASGGSVLTSPNGTFILTFPVGATGVDVIINPNNLNASYASLTLPADMTNLVSYPMGRITLNYAAQVYGYVTNGAVPVPNQTVLLTQNSQYPVAQVLTNSSGYFYFTNIGSGTYAASPALNPGQSAVPSSATITVNQSAAVAFVSSFTITGALGTLAGSVTYNGSPVVSGALVMVSTGALTYPPAVMYSSGAATITPIYGSATQGDGSFSIPVQSGSGYTVLVGMPIIGPNGSVTNYCTSYGAAVTGCTNNGASVTVNPGATTTQNLSLP